MTTDLPPIRRIVTGESPDGRSRILEDAVCAAVILAPSRPGYRVSNLWRTLGAEARVDAADTILDHQGIQPPPGGTVVRIIDFPPDIQDPEARRRAHEEHFKTMWADADHHPDSTRHPGMHVTDSVDYAIMLEGELVAIMDDGETVMRAGDVLIQRGTNHAWSNQSGRMARIAFVLVAAAR